MPMLIRKEGADAARRPFAAKGHGHVWMDKQRLYSHMSTGRAGAVLEVDNRHYCNEDG